MKTLLVTASILSLLALPGTASANRTSCDGKRHYQRRVVRDVVHDWFIAEPRADALLELVQAEQGIAACSAGAGRAVRLHATSLPRGLDLDQLGGILLANELEWAGLLPAPHEGLAGEFFRVPARRRLAYDEPTAE